MWDSTTSCWSQTSFFSYLWQCTQFQKDEYSAILWAKPYCNVDTGPRKESDEDMDASVRTVYSIEMLHETGGTAENRGIYQSQAKLISEHRNLKLNKRYILVWLARPLTITMKQLSLWQTANMKTKQTTEHSNDLLIKVMIRATAHIYIQWGPKLCFLSSHVNELDLFPDRNFARVVVFTLHWACLGTLLQSPMFCKHRLGKQRGSTDSVSKLSRRISSKNVQRGKGSSIECKLSMYCRYCKSKMHAHHCELCAP